jgi:hypothetical protein
MGAPFQALKNRMAAQTQGVALGYLSAALPAPLLLRPHLRSEWVQVRQFTEFCTSTSSFHRAQNTTIHSAHSTTIRPFSRANGAEVTSPGQRPGLAVRPRSIRPEGAERYLVFIGKTTDFSARCIDIALTEEPLG